MPQFRAVGIVWWRGYRYRAERILSDHVVHRGTALLAKLREIFRRYVSQPAERVIELINPILRGWVNYFAVGTLKPVLFVYPRLAREERPATR